MGTAGPTAVLAAGTDRGNEVMAHVGARTGLPVAANCTEVEPGDPFLVTRLRGGGSLLEDARLHGEVKLLTVAPHSIQAEEGPAAGGWSVEEFSPALQDTDFRVQVARQEGRPAGKQEGKVKAHQSYSSGLSQFSNARFAVTWTVPTLGNNTLPRSST